MMCRATEACQALQQMGISESAIIALLLQLQGSANDHAQLFNWTDIDVSLPEAKVSSLWLCSCLEAFDYHDYLRPSSLALECLGSHIAADTDKLRRARI